MCICHVNMPFSWFFKYFIWRWNNDLRLCNFRVHFGELDSMFFWFIFSFTSIALFCLLDFDLLASEVGVENMKWSIKRFESRGKWVSMFLWLYVWTSNFIWPRFDGGFFRDDRKGYIWRLKVKCIKQKGELDL